MIQLCVMILLIGVGMILYGVWEYKTVYSDQHFTDAEVVAFQAYRTSSAAMRAMAAISGMVVPVVELKMETGEVKRMKLYNIAVMKSQLVQMPELDIGGKVQVTYFGKRPKEVFLTNHQLAQTPAKISPAMIIGIVLALLGLGMLALTIYFYYFV